MPAFPYPPLDGGLSTLAVASAIPPNRAVIADNAAIPSPGSVRSRKGARRAVLSQEGAAPLGVCQVTFANGTTKVVAKIGAAYYALTIGSSPTYLITKGSSLGVTATASTFRPFMLVFGNNLVVLDKSENWYYDGTYMGELGRDAPSIAAITLTPGSGGSMQANGTYSYKFAFYAPTLDQEGTLSAAKSGNTGAGQTKNTITLASGVTDELDSVWTSVRVYRTTDAGSTYQLAVTLTATGDDTVADGSLGAVAADTEYIKLPGARCGGVHQGCVFAVTDSDPTLAYVSEAGFPQRYKTSRTLRIGRQDGDDTVSFVNQGGRFFAIKERSMWVLLGSDMATWEWVEVEGGLGSPSPHGSVVAGGVAYVWNREHGPFAFRGNEIARVGARIRDEVKALSVSSDAAIVAAYDPVEEAVCFFVTEDSVRRTAYVYWVETDAWTTYRQLPDVQCAGRVERTDGERLLVGGSDEFWAWLSDVAGRDDAGNNAALSGTVVSLAAADTIETAGSLPTTGDGLESMWLTVVRFSSNALTFESNLITSNTSANITVGAFTGITPTAGDFWFVGSVNLHLLSKTFDLGDIRRKQLESVVFAREKQASTADIYARVRVDGETSAGWDNVDDVSDDRAVEIGPDPGNGGANGYEFQVEIRHFGVDGPVVLEGGEFVSRDTGQRR